MGKMYDYLAVMTQLKIQVQPESTHSLHNYIILPHFLYTSFLSPSALYLAEDIASTTKENVLVFSLGVALYESYKKKSFYTRGILNSTKKTCRVSYL